jgi:hypothetical protein
VLSKETRNALVPIENTKAPGFSEVFEVMMGWSPRTGNGHLARYEEGEDEAA